MEASPPRLQLRLVAATYVAVFAVSALLVFGRYLQYVRNPQDAAAASGMYAGGDLLLEIFICLMLLVPTAALVFVIRKSDSACRTYAKVLLGLSITGPISLALLPLPVLNQWYWGDAIIFRLFAIPIFLGVLLCSRWVTRSQRARRLMTYAILIEGTTLVVVVSGLFLFSKGPHG